MCLTLVGYVSHTTSPQQAQHSHMHGPAAACCNDAAAHPPEVGEDKCLDDFAEQHHDGPHPAAQGLQQVLVALQDLQRTRTHTHTGEGQGSDSSRAQTPEPV